MAAKNNLTMTSDVQVTAREIDFVTRFARNWQHLRDILGIMRPIKKAAGNRPEIQDCKRDARAERRRG